MRSLAVNNKITWTDTGIRKGVPLLKSSRIPVDTIVRHISLGWSKDQLIELFPTIKKKYLDKLLEESSPARKASK